MNITGQLPHAALVKAAAVNGVSNAIINGAISWFTTDDSQPIYLTQDMISSDMHTVFGGAVPLAVSLAFILTAIGYFTTKMQGKPSYFPKVFLLSLKHSVYAFGIVAIAGMLLQRFAGSIEVSMLSAAVVTGIIAGLVAAIVTYETTRSMILHSNSKTDA
jgi:hypothetical protein